MPMRQWSLLRCIHPHNALAHLWDPFFISSANHQFQKYLHVEEIIIDLKWFWNVFCSVYGFSWNHTLDIKLSKLRVTSNKGCMLMSSWCGVSQSSECKFILIWFGSICWSSVESLEIQWVLPLEYPGPFSTARAV